MKFDFQLEVVQLSVDLVSVGNCASELGGNSFRVTQPIGLGLLTPRTRLDGSINVVF